MIIEKKPKFIYSLMSILKFIKKNKVSASKKFENELEKKIKNLINFPNKFKKSTYFEDEAYRDLIYNGYTIIYKIEEEKITILEIFKWQER
ncbi:MAG: type II toxin-antitoxin system RelE/ParE family toxin [Sulfurimonas sp.]|jgi:plasmid stabilization system protein ParE